MTVFVESKNFVFPQGGGLDQNLLLSSAIFQDLRGVCDQLYQHNESAKKGVFSQVKKWKGVNAEVV